MRRGDNYYCLFRALTSRVEQPLARARMYAFRSCGFMPCTRTDVQVPTCHIHRHPSRQRPPSSVSQSFLRSLTAAVSGYNWLCLTASVPEPTSEVLSSAHTHSVGVRGDLNPENTSPLPLTPNCGMCTGIALRFGTCTRHATGNIIAQWEQVMPTCHLLGTSHH